MTYKEGLRPRHSHEQHGAVFSLWSR